VASLKAIWSQHVSRPSIETQSKLVADVKDHSEMAAEMLAGSDFSRLFVDDQWINEPPADVEPTFA